jgi:hypothetical protein
MNCCSKTNEAWYNERLWTYLQVLSESLFALMESLDMVVV